jgi:ATP-dependent Lon protease
MEIVQLENPTRMPLLPLRDVVVYPHMVIPLFVGREKSINALNKAMKDNKKVFLVAQKNASQDDPIQEDVYDIGTIATILQLLKLPDGTVKVLVEGEQRGRVAKLIESDDLIECEVDVLDTQVLEDRDEEVMVRSVISQFEKYVQFSKKVPSEVLTSLNGIADPGRLADTIAAHMSLKIAEKQEVLETVDLKDRLEHLLRLMETEIDLLQVEKRIRGRVKKQMEKSQREYYLNEQMKAIQKELGDLEEGGANETDELLRRVEASGMSKEARNKAQAEISKLRMMSPMSAEASVVRSYVEWLANLPWKKRSKVKHDISEAEKILNEDHYGLEEVKTRILEYLAVQSRVKKLKGPILCLVGPPGVGKTSLGQSIARATNRKFVRMSLGGVRDESEIRGHRRTYIGSMPGKILQKLTKTKVKNPLFLLDEIDKMGMDHRGDPSSALLEVLDPEQNSTFNDHYLEVDYDLSDVMFICTSNSMNIPGPLLDRMEVIRIPGYTEDEKRNIAEQYLIPKQMEANGLNAGELTLTSEVVMDIIRYYTREAGVRNLDREIAKICRKVVKLQVSSQSAEGVEITTDTLEEFAGVRKFSYGVAEKDNQIGQVTGLAWTSVGGELLTLECSVVKGKGRITRTGKLGDVMQESIQAAMTVVKSRAQGLGIWPNFIDKYDLHVHVPEGATPKDGPSAGIGMVTALVSALTRIPVRADVAMTGEITLRGQVLPIGGLKEKLLAAHRGGIKTVIIPDENERDLREIPENIKKDLIIKPVKWIDQVLEHALEYKPISLTDEQIESELIREKKNNEGGSDRLHTH